MTRLSWPLAAWRADERGVAAIEATFVCGLLGAALMNVVEVTRYAYISTQVAAVTQAAAQAAVVSCSPSETPVMTKCDKVRDAITMSIQSSSLGDAVTLAEEGALTEAWYCVNGTGDLQRVADAGSKPTNCSGVDKPGDTPGLYLQVQTAYTYQPLFPGLTIAETFSDKIEKKAWMRTL